MRLTLTVLVGLLAAGAARADGAVFPVPGLGSAYPSHRVETDEAHPDHVFVIRQQLNFRSGGRDETTFADLAPANPVTIPPGRGTALLIVGRAAADRYRTAAEVAEAVFSGEIPGVIKREFNDREGVPAWSGRELTVTYRLRRIASGDGWEVVRTSWGPMWQWFLAAGFVTAAAVFGGWRLLRRRNPYPSGPSAGTLGSSGTSDISPGRGP